MALFSGLDEKNKKAVYFAMYYQPDATNNDNSCKWFSKRAFAYEIFFENQQL